MSAEKGYRPFFFGARQWVVEKEKFLNRWMPAMGVPFRMGVGGSFDIIAGRTKRAPLWMQNIGMEWFYRLLQEPKRMWKRYATTNPVFVWMVMKEYFKKNQYLIPKTCNAKFKDLTPFLTG